MKFPGAAGQVLFCQEGLCYMNLVITFEIFKMMNLFSKFVISTSVDADDLLLVEQLHCCKSLAVFRIFYSRLAIPAMS